MHRLIRCPHCGHEFNSFLPDVTPEEADALADDDIVVISCPNCLKQSIVRRKDLPGLPELP
jgi:predicted RNA-binding Zn-ribbon protein involved in translation (DUF1610 family)